MSHNGWELNEGIETDVLVLGGGLAGLAAAINLARGGLRVICLEPRQEFQSIVGESLDWSAPDLLAALHLPMEQLVATEGATFKKHIVLHDLDGRKQTYEPNPWLARFPLNVEVRTMHLDRLHVQAELEQTAKAYSVTTLHERATTVQGTSRRITFVETSGGKTIHPRWVVDATGAAASLLGRHFNLQSVSYGPRKVSIWGHIKGENGSESTSLYALRGKTHYMEWLWEIPIRPGVTSLGYVAPGSEIKTQRSMGLSTAEIFRSQLAKYDRFDELLEQGQPADLNVTSFLCRTYKGVCGENWIIIGEAASQSDPITGNGVTAALRHAAEASALICKYRHRDSIPLLARVAYNLRVFQMGRFFNSLIEKIFYEPQVRGRIGVLRAGDVYTIPAWSTNLVYSRVKPRGMFATATFCSVLCGMRMLAWGLSRGSERPKKLPSQTSESQFAGRVTRHALHLQG